jgi:lysine 2,3-aminomutase
MLSMSDSKVVVRNYEGFISTYAQPTDYKAHNPQTCPYCWTQREEAGQEGVAGLLSGHRRSIAPEGWGTVHARRTSAVDMHLPMEIGGLPVEIVSSSQMVEVTA